MRTTKICWFAIFIAYITLTQAVPSLALATDKNTINGADTVWVLISAALVMLMTPAVGLFYGGMVRKKNVLSIITQSFIVLALISIQWILWGYSLVFGHDSYHGLIGGLEFIGLNGVGASPNPDYAPTIPASVFMIYQAMFAIITPVLITGAFADRMKFSTFIIFTLIWTTIVYDPIAHWIWGTGGWLRELGAVDFAGGVVVHISAGLSALAAAIIIGKRIGFKSDNMAPHNVPMTLLGGILLWFGWFGFNAGSALSAGSLAANAFVATNTAAAAGASIWMLVSWKHGGKPNALGIVTGAIAGLAAITPASGYVGPLAALVIGGGAGFICYFVMHLKNRKTMIDDSLDVFACHGAGSAWGVMATGIFASAVVNPLGKNGLLFGGHELIISQIVAITAAGIYSFVATTIILKILDSTMGLRVRDDEEIEGLDISQHGEKAYV